MAALGANSIAAVDIAKKIEEAKGARSQNKPISVEKRMQAQLRRVTTWQARHDKQRKKVDEARKTIARALAELQMAEQILQEVSERLGTEQCKQNKLAK